MSTIKYKLANAPMGLVAMEAITEIEQLEQELQKTREQLEKAEKVIEYFEAHEEYWFRFKVDMRARQYFKHKQGEG